MTSAVTTCTSEESMLPDFDYSGTDLNTWTVVWGEASGLLDDEVPSKTWQRKSRRAHEEPLSRRIWETYTRLLRVPPKELVVKRFWETYTRPLMVPSHGVGDVIAADSAYVFSYESLCSDTGETDITEQSDDRVAVEETRQVLRDLASSDLEDEGDERFEESVQSLIVLYGGRAVCEIDYLIRDEQIPPDAIRFVLRVLGDIDHPKTHGYRQWLLQRVLLYSSSAIIRDGANVGLALLDDPEALPVLRKAIEKETSPLVMKFLDKTIRQLEETEASVSLPAQGRP